MTARFTRRTARSRVAAVVALWLTTSVAASAEEITLYDASPERVANRLHRALFTRVDRDGAVHAGDEVDPHLWPNSKYPLAGERHAEILRRLDELVSPAGLKTLDEPRKRAVLQRDLWAVFDWSCFPFGHPAPEDHDEERRELQTRLARAIRALALDAKAIAALGDNLAEAVAAKTHPAEFDAARPDAPFLPGDLFAADGPWVLVSGSREVNGLASPSHSAFFGGRSAFFTFIRLPAGRAATLAYLERLNSVPSFWKARESGPDDETPDERRALREDLPQFPEGTQVALVRRMLLVDADGNPTPSPLVESVQLRVFRRIEFVHPRPEQRAQSFFEFELSRAALFAGRSGGLRPTPGEKLALPGFLLVTGTTDPFERDHDGARAHWMATTQTCVHCHHEAGLYSVHTFARRFTGPPGEGRSIGPGLRPIDRDEETRRAVEWKRGRFDGSLLREMIAAER